jgi:hypothetical protein
LLRDVTNCKRDNNIEVLLSFINDVDYKFCIYIVFYC